MLEFAGASNNRDSVDQEIQDEIAGGSVQTQRLVLNMPDNPSKTDSWFPVLAAGSPYADSDGNGLPDLLDSRISNHLQLTEGEEVEASGDADNDGFTNIEEYLNATDPRESNDPTVYYGGRDDWTHTRGNLNEQ